MCAVHAKHIRVLYFVQASGLSGACVCAALGADYQVGGDRCVTMVLYASCVDIDGPLQGTEGPGMSSYLMRLL